MTNSVMPPSTPTSFSATTMDDAARPITATIGLLCKEVAAALVCNGVDMQIKVGRKNTTLHVEHVGRIMLTEIDGDQVATKEISDKAFAKIVLDGAKRIVGSAGSGDALRIQQTGDLIEEARTIKFSRSPEARTR